MSFIKANLKHAYVQNTKAGKSFKHLVVETVVTVDFMLFDNFPNVDDVFKSYQSLVGSELMIPVTQTLYNGNFSFNLDGDGLPVQLSLSKPEPKPETKPSLNPISNMAKVGL